jgi:putative phosphoesterase
MKIGIISDTHDDIENVQTAIKIFNDEKVDYVIHAGDFVFPGVIKEFEKLNAKLIGVLGNNDGEKVQLLKNFLEIEGELKGELGEMEIEGLKFGIYHGTDKQLREQLAQSGKYNIFICGHTHRREPTSDGKYENHGKILILNPGTGHRKVKSVSGLFEEGGIIIFNTQSKEYKFVPLP